MTKMNRMSRALILAAVVGTGTGLAHAQSIRCVAMSGQQAPGAPAGAVFASFDQPIATTTAGVILRATLGVGKGGVSASNDVGIWRFPLGNGTPSLITREGNAAPQLPGVTLVELGHPVADSVNDAVAYWARLSGSGIGAGNDQGVFVREGANSHSIWYQTGSPFFGTLAGEIGDLQDYRDHGVINAGGYLAFTGALQSGLRGVFGIDLKTESRAIALQGEEAPSFTHPGAVYGSEFSSPVRDSFGDIAFRTRLAHGPGGVDASTDEAIFIWMATDHSYFHVAQRGQPMAHGRDAVFETLTDPIVTNEPRVGFGATLRRGVGGIDDTNDAALCSLCPCGSIEIHVERGESPVGALSNLQFDAFSRPLFSVESRLLFGANLRGPGVTEANDSSVWWLNLPVEFVMAAREGSPAPGTSSTFADFEVQSDDFWMGTAPGAQLVFTGRTAGGQRGLWVFTPYRGTRLLVIEGQSVEVAPGDARQVVSLAPFSEGYSINGRRAVVTEDRQVVFLAEVTGGQSAVFVAELPPMSLGCPSDWDNSGVINSQDFFAFLTDFFEETADVNNSGATDSQDFFDFLAAFFAGC